MAYVDLAANAVAFSGMYPPLPSWWGVRLVQTTNWWNGLWFIIIIASFYLSLCIIIVMYILLLSRRDHVISLVLFCYRLEGRHHLVFIGCKSLSFFYN